MLTIDSHQHFWHYAPEKQPWIDDQMADIRRDFLPPDLANEFKANQVSGCIAVQAEQTTAETDFLLDLASQHSFILGVVGWIDLRAADLKEQLKKYQGQQKLKGFRHVVQGETDPQFLLRPDFIKGIQTLGEFGYTYDLLILPHQLLSALELVKRFPTQKFVVDHLAKPYIKAGYLTGWAHMMTALGKCENVYCKISGLVTEADYQRWTPAQLSPYLDHVFHAFPAERLMYGSDWPVCLVAATYTQVLETLQAATASFSEVEKSWIFHKSCQTFYGL